jgi:hypothetical protein
MLAIRESTKERTMGEEQDGADKKKKTQASKRFVVTEKVRPPKKR